MQPSSSSSSALPPPTSLLYYNYDGLGSVRSISNATGDLQETYDYDAYGTLIGLAKRNATTGVLESLNTENFNLATSSYLFTGEQWDADLGMYFLRARYLNTNTGRFHTQDTYEGRTGEPLTLHKYLYANGNPAMFTDPSGHMTLGEISAVIGQIISFSVRFTFSVARSASLFSSALIKLVLYPFFKAVGKLSLKVNKPFEKVTRWQRFVRFFITPTKGYSTNTNTIWGNLVRSVTGNNKLSVDHAFLQRRWYSGGPNSWYKDPEALLGMRRLGNAGWNLYSVPSTFNSLMYRSLGHRVLFSGGIAASWTSVGMAVDYAWDNLVDSDKEE